MNDYISIDFDWPHDQFGDEFMRRHVLPNQANSWRKHKKVFGQYPRAGLRVNSLEFGKRIRIKGSFPKFLQGHNVFGSNQLERLVFQTVCAVFRELGIAIEPGLRRAVREAKINRIDVTGGFKLPSPDAVATSIRVLKTAYLDSSGEVRFFGNETIYVERKYRSRVILFYDKAMHLRKLVQRDCIALSPWMQNKVTRYVDSWLRFEVRLWPTKLKSLELMCIGDWDASTARDVLVRTLAEVKFNGAISLFDYSRVESKLTPAMFRTFLLWYHGEDISRICSQSVAARLKRMCKPLGINTDMPPPCFERVFQLDEWLNADKMYYRFPRWARERACVAGLPNFVP